MEQILTRIRPYDPAVSLVKATAVDGSVARLVTSLGAAFIISFAYPTVINKLPSLIQHVLNTLIGFSIMYYCFGNEVVHLLFDITITLVILKTIGGTLISVILTWVIVFGHLLYGYYDIVTSDNVARIDWTVCACGMSFKLTGLASDLYETIHPVDKGKKPPLESKSVGTLEIFGFSSFFCTCLVGPIIGYQRYVDLVNGTLYDVKNTPSSIPYGILRFLTGICFMGIYLYLLPYVPLDYFVSADFAAKPFYYKFFLAALRYKVIFKQYSSVWLLSEGASIITGLGYKGKNKDGTTDWSACAGIHVIQLDTALYTQSIISSFNLTTNDWVFRHVYKKCRFLNSKVASQTVSVVFLATWHGLLPGYYMCFLHEVVMVMVEKQVMDYGILKFGPMSSWPIVLRVISIPIFYLYHLFAMALPLGFFQLLTFERSMIFFKAMHYYTIYAYAVLIPLGKFLEIAVMRERGRQRRQAEEEKKKE